MLNYWDLPERDRAKLTEQELEAFVAAECMQQGVLRAKPLELVPEPEMPDADASVFVLRLGYHGVLAFTSSDDADRVKALVSATLGCHYVNGQSIDYLAKADLAVESRRVFSEGAVAQLRSAIERSTAAKQENAKRRADWEKSRDAESKALQGLYADWHECGRKALRMREIADVFADYVKTAGDAETAARFLQKVFARDEIDEAAEWCGVSIPRTDLPQAEPMPEPRAAEVSVSDDIQL